MNRIHIVLLKIVTKLNKQIADNNSIQFQLCK